MLKTLRNAWKDKEIRKKLLYTFMMLVVIRFGSELPIPGVNTSYFADFFAKQSGDAFNFFDAMTGGSFTSMSVLALSITPYITSSIIMQLLTIAIPKLEEMQREGEDGRKKIAEYTRYLTVVLALVESTAMAVGFGGQGLLVGYNDQGFLGKASLVIIAVLTMTAGSAFLMWIGERITEKGVGNGISIVLLFNIVSSLPQDVSTLYNTFMNGRIIAVQVVAVLMMLAVAVAMVVFVVYLQDGERRIPVQYSKKMVGRKMVGGQTSNIPLKVNTAGVIPVIFAGSLLQTPIIVCRFLGIYPASGEGASFAQKILKIMNQSDWCNFSNFGEAKYTLGLVVYIALLIFFAYFYTSITFNPLEIANNMKKQGGFIPGIRPGRPTSDYLTKVLNSIIFIGAVGLTIVAVIPIIFSGLFGANVSFSGTSLIIIVGVILETMKQIESMMLVRHYKGFLND